MIPQAEGLPLRAFPESFRRRRLGTYLGGPRCPGGSNQGHAGVSNGAATAWKTYEACKSDQTYGEYDMGSGRRRGGSWNVTHLQFFAQGPGQRNYL